MEENKSQGSSGIGFSLSTIENFYNRNKKVIIIAVVAIFVIAGGIFYYQNQIKAPREKTAANELYKAEYYFGLDSFNLALNGRPGGFMGFNEVIDEYNNTKSGNLAHYYAGICNLQLGKYQEAIDHLNDFSSDDVIIGSIALGCIGDAYRELNNSEKAANYYEKAASRNTNTFTTPIYLKKAAMTYEEDLKEYDKALAIYIKIQKEYGNTTEGRDVSKYIARIKTQTGK